VAPTPAQAASCVQLGQICVNNGQCCSHLCDTALTHRCI
jgi:hypothetical protein